MPPKRIYITLTPAQIKVLGALCDKLQIDRTNVLRVAIARLAEAEGVKG